MYSKKIIAAALSLTMGFALPTMGQEKFVDGQKDIFLCDFQDLAVSNQLFSHYDLAELQPSSFMQNLGFAVGRSWLFKLMDDQTSVNYFAGSCSEFTPAGTANAWLVSCRIDIPAKGCKLTWKSESLNADKLDGLKVFISTKGDTPEKDFPTTAAWESEAESAGASDMLDGEWIEHELSLDEYAGKSIWIAFVNQTTDGQVLCLDDVRVFFDGNYSVESTMPRLNKGNSAVVKGRFLAKRTKVNAFTIYCQAEGGELLSQTFSGLNLQPGESYDFTLSQAMTLKEKGTYGRYNLWAEVEGDQNIGLTDSVAAVNFVPTRRVVLEEGTGTWCGWCPQGILAIENLHSLYSDQIISIAVHNGDVMTVDAYDAALAFPGYPMGVVNRQYAAYPMRQVGNEFFFEGAGTFVEAVEVALKELQTVETILTEASLENGKLSLNSETRFALQPEAGNYRVVYVVMENDVTPAKTYQSNYMATYDLPIFGEFGRGGKYGKTTIPNLVYQEVARAIYPSFNGEADIVPTHPVADEVYAHEVNIDLSSATVEDSTCLVAVAMLLDSQTGYVLAADSKPVVFKEDTTGIDRVENCAALWPADIYDLKGRCVRRNATDMEALPKGIYVVNGKKIVR